MDWRSVNVSPILRLDLNLNLNLSLSLHLRRHLLIWLHLPCGLWPGR